MTGNVSLLFYLYDTSFLSHVYIAYPQPLGLWQISPLSLLLELLSCVISTLRRNPCNRALLKMRDSRGCTGSGLTSVPTCQLILSFNIHTAFASKSSKSMCSKSDIPSTPSAEWTDLENNRFLRHGGRLQRPTSWMAYPTRESPSTPNLTPAWTYNSPANSKLIGSRILHSSGEKPLPWVLSSLLWPWEPWH